MCTNLEWLYENNKDALISMLGAKGTEKCNCMLRNTCGFYGYCYCDEEWLNAEYVEPYKPPENDSWDRVKQDSKRSIFDYCNEYLSHLDKSEYTTQNMCLDIVCRCECLAKVERSCDDY